MSATSHHDSTMEAGLLRNQEQEEKLQLSGKELEDQPLGCPDSCPGQRNKRKMSPLRRVLVIALIGLIAMIGMAAAGGPCFGAGRHKVQLVKRQDPGSNTTASPSGSSTGQQNQDSKFVYSSSHGQAPVACHAFRPNTMYTLTHPRRQRYNRHNYCDDHHYRSPKWW